MGSNITLRTYSLKILIPASSKSFKEGKSVKDISVTYWQRYMSILMLVKKWSNIYFPIQNITFSDIYQSKFTPLFHQNPSSQWHHPIIDIEGILTKKTSLKSELKWWSLARRSSQSDSDRLKVDLSDRLQAHLNLRTYLCKLAVGVYPYQGRQRVLPFTPAVFALLPLPFFWNGVKPHRFQAMISTERDLSIYPAKSTNA